MKKIFLLAVFAFFGFSMQINAQTKTVTGKITDSKDGSSLPSVTVKDKNIDAKKDSFKTYNILTFSTLFILLDFCLSL